MTALITSDFCLQHKMTQGHPERPERLSSLLEHLANCGLMQDMKILEPVEATKEDLLLVHGIQYLTQLHKIEPQRGLVTLNPDMAMGRHSLKSARFVVGAALTGIQAVLSNQEKRVFCAVRPPGHHAEESTAMGFCFFNGVAIAAKQALRHTSIERVAILDFDVHHGNGTVEAFLNIPEVLVCSSFQFPHYPYRLQEIVQPNIVNTPLPALSTSRDFRQKIEATWMPALESHKPDLILVSAGFDAHRDDPLGDLLLDETDFAWITDFIVDFSNQFSNGRIVSILEGGYDLNALSKSVESHLIQLDQKQK